MLDDVFLGGLNSSVRNCSIQNSSTPGMLLLINAREGVGAGCFLWPHEISVRLLDISTGIVDCVQCLWRGEHYAIMAAANDWSYRVSPRFCVNNARCLPYTSCNCHSQIWRSPFAVCQNEGQPENEANTGPGYFESGCMKIQCTALRKYWPKD
jgi:hypothetical protein